MADNLEIMFDDLTPEAQERVLEFYSLKTVEDGNFDISPIIILQTGD